MFSLEEMIYKRKSFRSYTDEAVDEATIQKIKVFTDTLKPLYPNIKVRSEIVGKESVRSIFPWVTPQMIAVFSEETEGALENVGFMYQQLDLYIQSLGLGVCWLGGGKLRKQTVAEIVGDENLKCMMLFSFGHTKGETLRSDVAEFKRKILSEISDQADERLEPARLAPSSTNSQPWYFTHEGNVVHAYCNLRGLLRAKILGELNRIDMGIALAHMYIANPDTFQFFKTDEVTLVKDCDYIGSFTLD